MKSIKLHIVLDLAIVWGLIFVGIYLGVVRNFLFLVAIFPLFVWYGVRTLHWLIIAFSVFFLKPDIIETKSCRFAYRERVYQLIPASVLHYSIFLFNDTAIKGKYIFMGDSIFRHGEKLEITYYPKAKYIKCIKRIQD